jgi:hypothetical protein
MMLIYNSLQKHLIKKKKFLSLDTLFFFFLTLRNAFSRVGLGIGGGCARRMVDIGGAYRRRCVFSTDIWCRVAKG